MILMANTPAESVDRRVLCLHLLHRHASDAMKVRRVCSDAVVQCSVIQCDACRAFTLSTLSIT
jgi:hypothetical protein